MAIPQMDPAIMAKMGMQNPFMPPQPPPPTSATMGFQPYASDPQNQHKIAPFMSQPDQPLHPNQPGQMAILNPPKPAPMASTQPPTFASVRAAAANPAAPEPAPPDLNAPVNLPQTSPVIQTKAPKVTFDQLGHDQDVLRQYQTEGAGLNKINNPFLRGLAKVGDIAAPFLVGGGAMAIPGTTAHNLWLQDRQAGRIQSDQDALNNLLAQQKTQADIGHTQAETTAQQLVTISHDEAERLGNPSLEGQQVTQQAFQHILTNANTNQTRLQTNANTNQTRKDIAVAQGLTREKLAQLKPEQRDDKAIRLMQIPPTQRSDADNSYLAAYARWVDQTKTQPGIARAQAFAMFRPVKIVDDDGNEHYQYAGEAIKSGANTAGSMNFKTAAAMAKFMTSGKGGNTMTAYRTATDHLDLLGQAADALDNGDVQSINRLSNAWKEQTGQAGPTNFNSVKAMLSGELANVAKVTGATDSEIATAKEQINRAASPEQLRGVIETNQDLMDQKAKEMFEQYQSGMQGTPDFSRGGMNPARRTPVNGNGNPLKPPAQAGPKVGDVEGGFRFKGGNPADPNAWEKAVK